MDLRGWSKGENSDSRSSAIDLATMSDSVNSHDTNLIGYLVNDAVIANADTPVILASAQLPATERPGILGERRNTIHHLIVNAGRKPT